MIRDQRDEPRFLERSLVQRLAAGYTQCTKTDALPAFSEHSEGGSGVLVATENDLDDILYDTVFSVRQVAVSHAALLPVIGDTHASCQNETVPTADVGSVARRRDAWMRKYLTIIRSSWCYPIIVLLTPAVLLMSLAIVAADHLLLPIAHIVLLSAAVVSMGLFIGFLISLARVQRDGVDSRDEHDTNQAS